MKTDDIFELFLLENEAFFKISLIRSIGILTPKITQYQDSELNLLLHLHAGEYLEFVDALEELMVKELNFRIAEGGFDIEPLQVLKHEIEHEISSKKIAFFQTSQPSAYKKECLDRFRSIVSGMKIKMNIDLNPIQCSGIFEVVNEVLISLGWTICNNMMVLLDISYWLWIRTRKKLFLFWMDG